MSQRLDGKVAVITGGANGIGRACARRFSAEGAAVVVADLLDGPGNEAAEEITAAGGRASFVHLDATNRTDNAAAAAAAIDRYGGLDVVVTAAGISHQDYYSGDEEAELKMLQRSAAVLEDAARAFVEVDLAEWQKVLDVNLTGTLLALQACAERMLELDRGGSIITLASIAAKHPDAGPVPYVCSKAGVWMLTKKAARDLAAAGIRVNAIGPGFIDTHMTHVITLLPDERREEVLGQVPLGRRGTADEIANTALFLASDEASYFTGEILHPAGGFFTA